MNKKLSFVLIAVIVIVAVITILKPKDSGTIKFGIATILHGDFAALGENIVNASKLTVQKINDGGGINGRPVELFVQDAGVTSKDGLSAVQKLVSADGVSYIVGGMASNGTIAASSLADQKHVLIMTPVTGGSNIDNAGEYIFRNANSDILAGRDLANAVLKLGYSKVGVVSETTEYTLDIKKSFEDSIKKGGGSVVSSEEFQTDTKDFRALVSKVSAAKPQALLILSQTGVNAAQFIKQSREIGFNPTLFTDFTFVANTNAKEIVGSFDGVYFADPAYAADDSMTKAFLDLYEKTYGTPSLIPFHAAASHDALMMYAEAIEEVGDNPSDVKDWLLANVKDRKGLMGTFSLDEKGNSDLGFVIKIIKNGVPIPVSL